MGSAIGGILSESGQDILLIDRWKEHVDALNAGGLKLTEKSETRVIKVKATTDVQAVAQADLIVLLVKSYQTADTLKQVQSFIRKDTPVLSLQNGLGNEEKIAEILGAGRVLGGVTHAGSVMLGPGAVDFGRDRTCIGEMRGNLTDRVRDIVRIFSQADLEAEASDNILGMIWDKLLVNVAVSPISAITGLTHGEMQRVESLKATAFDAVQEAMRIAAAAGVKLSLQDPAEAWAKAMEGLSPGHKTLRFRPGAGIIHTQPGPYFPEILRVGGKPRTCIFDSHRSWLRAPYSPGARLSRIPHICRISTEQLTARGNENPICLLKGVPLGGIHDPAEFRIR